MIKNIVRALRLPFISASILPFVFGSLISKENFNLPGFLLGFIAMVCTHLSANLINDYADSKSGADWQDKKFYKFFGGSKLIQEKVFSERFYLYLAILFLALASVCVVLLTIILKSLLAIGLFLIIIVLGWSYSAKPLQFSYHRLGELVIFILFGPVAVMGGYFIQTKLFPDLRSFLLSLPFGLLTCAILFVNEIPDYPEDKKSGKITLVSITGQGRAYIIYYFLILLTFVSVALNAKLGYMNKFSYLSFILIFIPYKTINILENHYEDKIRLMQSSRLTIALSVFVGIILILSLII